MPTTIESTDGALEARVVRKISRRITPFIIVLYFRQDL